jgi:hypothetical protein
VQWHPIFAQLLRPLVEDYYEVRTNLPVGDLPREADIVLVRRTSDQPPPFRTLLHYLTTWNVIEFKGRSVSARIRDLDLLVELGLGIDRKLNEERARTELEPLDTTEVSLWYIANHIGQRFLDDAKSILGVLEESSPGVWRSQILSRPVFLIDSVGVTVDRESVPMHLVGEESAEIERELARVIAQEPGYWKVYGEFLRSLHPNIFEEASRMAPKEQPAEWNLRPFAEKVGLNKYLEPVAVGEMVAAKGAEQFLAELSSKLSPEKQKQLYELFGLKEPT